MKNWKKVLTMVMAMCMLLSLGTAAMAEISVETTSPTITGGSGTAESTFTGHIVATKLTVSVPTTVNFDIDPTLTAGTSPITAVAGGNQIGQITEPNLTVTNNSVVPITIAITDCGATATLVNTTPSSKEVMFAIKAEAPNFGTSGDWLMTTGVFPYAVLAAETTQIGANGGTATLHIFGQTGNGWTAGESFEITPVFTVKAATVTP